MTNRTEMGYLTMQSLANILLNINSHMSIYTLISKEEANEIIKSKENLLKLSKTKTKTKKKSDLKHLTEWMAEEVKQGNWEKFH